MVHIATFSAFPLMLQWNFTCVLRRKMNARCGLRAAACGIHCRSPQHRTQHRPQHRQHCYSYVRTLNRVHVHNSTQHASEIAGNSIAQLVEIQKKVEIRMFNSVRPAARGLGESMKRPFHKSCTHVQSQQ